MNGDTLILSVMELNKLSVVDFCNVVGGIEKRIASRVGGRDRFKNNMQLSSIFSIGVDMRIAKKSIDILKKCPYVTKYVYVGALSGRYMAYLVGILDCEGDYLLETKVIEQLKFSIYRLLDNGRNEFTTSKEYYDWNRTHQRGMVTVNTGGSELLMFECFSEDCSKIKSVLKNSSVQLIDYKEVYL